MDRYHAFEGVEPTILLRRSDNNNWNLLINTLPVKYQIYLKAVSHMNTIQLLTFQTSFTFWSRLVFSVLTLKIIYEPYTHFLLLEPIYMES